MYGKKVRQLRRWVQRLTRSKALSNGSAREGARKLFQAALEAEVEEHLSRYEQLKDGEGHQAVVRNGHAPRRLILTGVGPVAVRRPRIDEREAKGQGGHTEVYQQHSPAVSAPQPNPRRGPGNAVPQGDQHQRLRHCPGGDHGRRGVRAVRLRDQQAQAGVGE